MDKKEFEKLKKTWYKKLKEEGFVDIEADEDTLKSWDSGGYHRSRVSTEQTLWMQQNAEAYYGLASSFLHEFKFETELDKVIWEYHSNGISVRNITKLLKNAGIKKINRTAVWIVVKKCKEIMKKMYLQASQYE